MILLTFYLGGKTETELPLGLPKDYYTGFTGCMKDILIDYKSLHLLENRNGQSTSVIRYCGQSQPLERAFLFCLPVFEQQKNLYLLMESIILMYGKNLTNSNVFNNSSIASQLMMQTSAIIFFKRCFIPYVECSSVKLCLIRKPLVH